MQFYPLHMTLLNFVEGWRRAHVTTKNTIVPYLPVRNKIYSDYGLHSSFAFKEDTKLTQNFHLKELHCGIEAALEALAGVILQGLRLETSGGHLVRLHFLFASYVSHLLAAHDMLFVERGAFTAFPCHRRFIHRDFLAHSQCGTPRAMQVTTQASTSYHERKF